jgi:nucleoside-triphosphatase THEP1
MHTFIVGNHTTDRSGFIRRLLRESGTTLPIHGFCTTTLTDGSEVSRIHIHSAAGARRYSGENLVGLCQSQTATAFTDVFENHARLLEKKSGGGIILMDELGPMEGGAPRFCTAVHACLDGDTPVLAAVRDNDTEFLRSVRKHPKARCFFLGGDDEALFSEALGFFTEQLAGAKT